MAPMTAMDDPLLTVAEAARAKIEAVRASSGHLDAYLRIGITGRRAGRFAYELALVDPTDAGAEDLVVETRGLRVLVDPSDAAQLKGATIDLDESTFGGALRVDNPNEGWADPLASRVQQVLDVQINPGVAAHGGHVELLDVRDHVAYIELGGGCQGCAQVDVTLRQGIEVAIKAAVPEIVAITDTTDHAAGTNPYYSPSKK